MAAEYVRSSLTDEYNVVFSQASECTAEQAEKVVMNALITAANFDDSSTTYQSTSGGRNVTWSREKLSDTMVDTCAISNYPNGTVTSKSVLLVESEPVYHPVQEFAASICSKTISVLDGDKNTSSLKLLECSPFYDANYVIDQSTVQECFDNVAATSVTSSTPAGAQLKASFDLSNTNILIQHAMQSRWNTHPGPYEGLSTVGENPTAMSQHSDFNTTKAFGMSGTSLAGDTNYTSRWAQSSTVNGEVTFVDIPDANQPCKNNLRVSDRTDYTTSLNLDDDVGMYKIVQDAPDIFVDFLCYEYVDSSSNVASEFVVNNNAPIFNKNKPSVFGANTDKVNCSVPESLNESQFFAMLGSAAGDNVSDNWNFNVEITTSANSGYNLRPSDHRLVETLDNSNLADSMFYMENYVSDAHEITFSSGSVTVSASDYGVTSTASQLVVDLSDGEKLPSAFESVNGKCKIDSNTVSTRTGDISNNGMSNITASVFYTGESTTGLSPISDVEKVNAYFACSVQKVVQDTNTDTVKFLQNTGAIVNLYTDADGIVNHAFDASDYSFAFANNTSDNVVWRLNSTNELLNKQPSLSLDENYTQTLKDSNPTMNIYGTFKNLAADNVTYHEFRNKLTAKKLADLNLNTVVNNTLGWELAYSDPSDNFLKTDGNTAAYTQKVAHLPNLENSQDAMLSYLNTAGASLSYKYEYLPYYRETPTSKPIYTCDSLKLTYSPVDNSSNVTEYNIQIPTTNTTRDVQMSETLVEVSPTDYKDLLISRTAQSFIKANAVLKRRTVINSIDVTFPALYGPFTNIDMCIKGITQTSIDYVVFYNGVLTYDIVLKKSTVPAEIVILNQYELTESYNLNGSDSLILEGSFVVADLKPFTGIFQGKDISDNFVTITTGTIDVDTYYSFDTTYNLVFGSPSVPTVNTVMWYEYDQSNLILDREFYYVPFILSQDAIYSIESFTFNDGNIANTLVGSSKFLTSADGYAAITGWTSFDYNVTVLTEPSTNSTTLTVKKTSGVEVFHITFSDIITNFGYYLISHFPSDIWRFNKSLGESDSINTSTETFSLTDYSIDSENSNVLPVVGSDGVYLYSNKNGSSSFDSSTISVGSSMSFRVLGDYVSANLVGSVSNPTSNEELTNSLSFQYTSGNDYSASISLPWYRGYASPTPLSHTVQQYTIARQKLLVDFNVKRAGDTLLTQRLTTHLNEDFIVNNLFDSGTSNSFNLNLKSKLLYSIPPTSVYSLDGGYKIIYPIDITGDKVTVSMYVDNSYTGYQTLEQTINTTLKFNSLYTFAGEGPVAIRPSRVKLYNSNFQFNKFSYLVNYVSHTLKVHKAVANVSNLTTNHLGNPGLHNVWTLFKSLNTYNDRVNGINIGSKNIGQISTKREISQIVTYFVSCAPYLKFETISIANNPTIPYNYATTYTSNKTVRYLAYTGETNTFNPFKPSFLIRDNSNNDLSITNDANYLNDITFTYISPPSLNDMFKFANNSRLGIIVPGVLLTVTMYAAKVIIPGVTTSLQLCQLPITSIQSSLPSNIDQNVNIILRSRNENGSINFSLIESLALARLGTQTNASYASVFKTPATPTQSLWYNINFNIGNSSWNNLASNTFQITVDGVKAKLYTVADINKSQKNVRRIYKYTMGTTIDLYSYKINREQTLNLPFSGVRVYYDYELPNTSYSSTGSAIQDYNDILSAVTPALSGTINWVADTDSDYDSDTSVYVSWAFGNSETSLNMPMKMFDILSSQRQWVFIKLAPFMQFKNQFGLTVSEISWDGSVIAPTIKTNNSIAGFTPGLIANNSTSMQEYSISTADKDVTARLSVLENLVKTHILSHLV